MDSERRKQVNDVLQSALDRTPEERDAFLRSACAGDETLEREVRSLLASDERAGRFLENAAMEVAARAMARGQSRDRSFGGRNWGIPGLYDPVNDSRAAGRCEKRRGRSRRYNYLETWELRIPQMVHPLG